MELDEFLDRETVEQIDACYARPRQFPTDDDRSWWENVGSVIRYLLVGGGGLALLGWMGRGNGWV